MKSQHSFMMLLAFGCRSFPSVLAWQNMQVNTQRETTATTRRKFVDFHKNLALATSVVSVVGQRQVANAVADPGLKLVARRLEQEVLQQPTPTVVDDGMAGVDNMFYPDFMAGTWNVTQTLVQASTPLGLIYLGGPNGDLSIAKKTQSETASRLHVPVTLQFRYVPTKWGVAEDRVFNTRSRLNAFAGRTVVASTAYADVGSCNRKSILAQGGSEDDPLQTTFVRFKGPAAQKTFLTSHRTDPVVQISSATTTWTGSEGFRSIFALTNENTAPPIFTDTECIWQFTKQDNDHVQGRLRIASYLNAQQDKLYFETRNRAVSLLDYALDLRRVG